MLDKIKALFKEELQYTHTAGLLQQIANIIHMIHGQYMKDGEGKNAAIDEICAILQSHKDKPGTEQPTVAQAPTPQEI